MFSAIRSKIGHIFGYPTDEENLHDVEERLRQRQAASQSPGVQAAIAKPIAETDCFRSTGVVTLLEATHGVLNNTFYFNIEAAANVVTELTEGCTVKYLAHKSHAQDASVRIVRILSIETGVWDTQTEKQIDEMVETLKKLPPEYLLTQQRSIMAKVKERNGGTLVMDVGSSEMLVNMKDVCLNFVPMVGDRVVLVATVEKSDTFVDGAGENINVLEVHAQLHKQAKGRVTKLNMNGRCGIIDGKYYFSFDALHEGYATPRMRDAVIVDAIESDHPEGYLWRCIKVILDDNVEPSHRFDRPEPMLTIANDAFDTRNKNGIEITDFLHVVLTDCRGKRELKFVVSNNGTQTHKILRSIFQNKRQTQCVLLVPESHQTVTLDPGEKFEYCIEVTGRLFGQSTERLTIHFAGDFGIERHIGIDVVDPTQPKAMVQPVSSNYNNRERNKSHTFSVWKRQGDVIPGVRLAPRSNFIYRKLDQYNVPESLKKAVLEMGTSAEINESLMFITPFEEALSIKSYKRYMDCLLYLEEIQMFHNIRRYDMERAHFQKENDFLTLVIVNMAECRPSLVIGDSVKASCPWTDGENAIKQEGMIHKIFQDKIYLKFHEAFHSRYNGEDWRLEFYFSRQSLRKQHYAVSAVATKMGEEFLFPSKIVTRQLQLDVELNEDGAMLCRNQRTGNQTVLPWYNKNLNVVQKAAIVNILRGEARPMPYIVFGPPGTGKTVTTIEAILQLCTQISDSRILVATPSNSAADLITERIIDSELFQPGDFVRLVGRNAIEREMIPEHLLPYCAMCDIARVDTVKNEMETTKSGLKLRCNAAVLGRHRITIGTCNTLGTLVQMEFPRDHFTHVVIDESGQCIEPEVLIPVSLLNKMTGQVIFAGDPMQLGPVVLSRYALDNGLGTSMLVRLLERFPYLRDPERFEKGYDPRLVTKLLYCYRSLPSVMKLYNQLSYNNELLAVLSATDSEESKLLQSLAHILPNPDTRTQDHGVFFYGLLGENKKEYDSPSWYNSLEARKIAEFIAAMYRDGKIVPDDIAVITPYQKQVRYIRSILKEYNMVTPKIGTVEEFQGQERNIVLVSTVRSSAKLVREHDLQHQLGFVKSLKRMNVAISRPRALLIVFGNPHLLAKDTNWRYLIRDCVKNGTYVGCGMPDCVADDDDDD